MKKVSIQKAFDKFKPETCVFVISADKAGKPNGMVAAWKTRCSVEPPLFAVALSKEGNTQRLIREIKEFVIAVPNKELQKYVDFFGGKSGVKVDKFKASKIETEKAKFVKLPLISKATMNLECRLVREINCGDHFMFIGKILAAYINKNKKVLYYCGRGTKRGKRTYVEI